MVLNGSEWIKSQRMNNEALQVTATRESFRKAVEQSHVLCFCLLIGEIKREINEHMILTRLWWVFLEHDTTEKIPKREMAEYWNSSSSMVDLWGFKPLVAICRCLYSTQWKFSIHILNFQRHWINSVVNSIAIEFKRRWWRKLLSQPLGGRRGNSFLLPSNARIVKYLWWYCTATAVYVLVTVCLFKFPFQALFFCHLSFRALVNYIVCIIYVSLSRHVGLTCM